MSPSPAELAADAEAQIADGAANPALGDLVAKMVGLKDSLDELEQQRKELKEQYDELRKRYVPEKLQELGISGAKFPFGTLSLRHKLAARVPKERQAECRQWCLDNKRDGLLTIQSSAVLDLANDLIERGIALPNFISTFTEETAVLTKKGVTK